MYIEIYEFFESTCLRKVKLADDMWNWFQVDYFTLFSQISAKFLAFVLGA
jgi:hypothetical protein